VISSCSRMPSGSAALQGGTCRAKARRYNGTLDLWSQFVTTSHVNTDIPEAQPPRRHYIARISKQGCGTVAAKNLLARQRLGKNQKPLAKAPRRRGPRRRSSFHAALAALAALRLCEKPFFAFPGFLRLLTRHSYPTGQPPLRHTQLPVVQSSSLVPPGEWDFGRGALRAPAGGLSPSLRIGRAWDAVGERFALPREG
jgi:hypothetical protein